MTEVVKVTVLMSVYNGEKYLCEAIDSILAQTFSDFEFLIIDDASTDNTKKILSDYSDERIRVFENQENLGLTKSLNVGLALSSGDYIARMDADDISMPKRVETQVKFLERNPDIAAVGTGSYDIDFEGNILAEKIPVAYPGYSDLLTVNQFVHGSLLFRKNVLIKEGGYSEEFRYCQDYELMLKLSKKYRLANIQTPLYKLRYHDSSICSVNPQKSILYHIMAIRCSKDENIDNLISIMDRYDDSFIPKKEILHCLSKSEKLRYHQMMSSYFRKNNRLKEARNEYLNILSISPLNILNLFNLFRSFLGFHLNEHFSKLNCKYHNIMNRK